MKKSDIILLSSILFIALIGLFVVRTIEKSSELENGVAMVLYHDQPILEIKLSDGSFDILIPEHVIQAQVGEYIYIVSGDNGPVTIEYDNGRVRVIDETSPRNICQDQGWSNNPIKPITCLPNNLIIVIQDESEPPLIDGWG